MASIADLYRQVLGREPDPGGLAYWSSMFGPTVDPTEAATFRSVAAVTEPPAPAPAPAPAPVYYDPPAPTPAPAPVTAVPTPASYSALLQAPAPAPINISAAAAEEVRNAYLKYVGREPTAQESAYWVGTQSTQNPISQIVRNIADAAQQAPAPAPSIAPAPAPAATSAPAPAASSTILPPAPSAEQGILNLYQQYLGRDPRQTPGDTGLQYWMQQFGPTIEPEEVEAFKSVAQRETSGGTSAPAPASQYATIEDLYQRLLGRAPDESGKEYWTKQLMDPSSPGGATITPEEVESFKTTASRIQQTLTPEQRKENAPLPGFDISSFFPGGTETGFRGEPLDPSQSTLSPNFADYVYRMLAKGEQAANLPFQPFTGERFAGPTGLQQEVFQRYGALAEPGQFAEATGIARLAAQQAQGMGYAPGQFAPERISAPGAQAAQLAAAPTMEGIAAEAARLGAIPQMLAAQMQGPERLGFERVGAERIAAPTLRDLQMQAAAPVGAERVGTRDITAAQAAFRPNLQAFRMEAPTERVTAESFTAPGTAAGFMSPFLQEALSPQLREAQRQADIARTGRQARFAQAGAYGGARQAIEESEAERNLQQRLADITGVGYQTAFQQAQEQFNREQAARQAAQQANIGTGLTVGRENLAAQLGVQQLGTQTGLQTALANLTAEQQARVQSEANRLQAQGMNQQQALQAALANQQTQQQANLQNLSAALQTQGLQAQTGMEAQRLNQATGLQALLANQAAGMQAGQFNVQQQQQAALQNAQMEQQARANNMQMLSQYGLRGADLVQQANMLTAQQMQAARAANQQMLGQYGLQQGQFGQAANILNAQQQLAAQQANQQQALEAQRLAEQSRQFGAGFGMRGIGQQLSAGQLMSGIGAQAGQFGLQGLAGMLGAGQQQQTLAQQPYDFGYQQFLQSQQYPFQQATFMGSLLGGLPLKAATYDTGTSGLAGMLSGLATGAGIYGALNK